MRITYTYTETTRSVVIEHDAPARGTTVGDGDSSPPSRRPPAARAALPRSGTARPSHLQLVRRAA